LLSNQVLATAIANTLDSLAALITAESGSLAARWSNWIVTARPIAKVFGKMFAA
jgi:hypothetical protein